MTRYDEALTVNCFIEDVLIQKALQLFMIKMSLNRKLRIRHEVYLVKVYKVIFQPDLLPASRRLSIITK